MNLKELTPKQRKQLQFIEFLVRSASGVWFVAYQSWLRDHAVRIGQMRLSPSVEESEYYTDEGDLEVDYSGVWKLIEVKRISRNFSGLNSWPFRDEFIVDRIETYDKKVKPVYGYMVVSNDYKGMAFVDVDKTKGVWYIDKKTNKMYSEDIKPRVEKYYFCPIDLVKWVPILKA
jgi:hypothetical protein